MIAYQKNNRKESSHSGAKTICVAGVGGAGCNVLDRMALEGMTNAELVAINCDVRALQNTMCPRQLQLGANLTRGLGTGGDPDLGRAAVEDSREELKQLFDQRDMVFLCAGLGGGTGSGATPQLVQAARAEGAFVVVFAILPFSFEGRRRLNQAARALEELRREADVVIVFENDRMGELSLNKEGIQQAFAAADTIISQSIRSIHTLVRQPGLIQIGMDDLMSALRNDDARCLFGYGDAKGENRAQEALKRALKSPLINQGDLLDETQTILIHVAGGEDLTLFEVELLMREMEKHVPENAQILFGTAIDPKLGELLSVSIISSLSARAPEQTDPGTDIPDAESTGGKATGEPGLDGAPPPTADSPDQQPDQAETAGHSQAVDDAPQVSRPVAENANPDTATPDLFGLDVETRAPAQTDPPSDEPASPGAPSHGALTEDETTASSPPREVPTAEHSSPLQPFVSDSPATAPQNPGQSTTNPFQFSHAPSNSSTPLGRRLPNFESPLSQTPAESTGASRSSLLKSLAAGSVPLEKAESPQLFPLPNHAAADGDTIGASNASQDHNADRVAWDEEGEVNPIAAAMSSGDDPSERDFPEDNAQAISAFDSADSSASVETRETAAELEPVDHDEERDFGRPEADRGTIEPFPSQQPETGRSGSQARTGASRAASGHQGMLDLDPASRGRFDQSEPNIVDGQDLDVPAFLRRGK